MIDSSERYVIIRNKKKKKKKSLGYYNLSTVRGNIIKLHGG